MFNFPVDNFSSHEAEDLSMRERLAKYIPPKEEWTPVDEPTKREYPTNLGREARGQATKRAITIYSFCLPMGESGYKKGEKME
jgi:hypothetical protein